MTLKEYLLSFDPPEPPNPDLLTDEEYKSMTPREYFRYMYIPKEWANMKYPLQSNPIRPIKRRFT